MSSRHLGVIAAAIAVQILLATNAVSQSGDVFSFIPLGGRDLLTRILQGNPPQSELRGILDGKKSREEWVAYLQNHGAALKIPQSISDTERQTLADYLSFNMPLPASQIPAAPARADWSHILPPDGRDFMMERCQGCHIITVVVTQQRTREAWLGTMNKPSHIRIKLSKEQREALANYLVLNAGIPLDDIPSELRAGGASY